MRARRRQWLPLLLAVACGCASYGFADRPTRSGSATDVAVHTVTIDAHSGADPATLTQALVQELAAAGLTAAAWKASESGATQLRCRISLRDDTELSGGSYVAVRTACDLDGSEFTTHEGEALLAVSAPDRTLGRSRATEDAARTTFVEVANALAARLEPGT